MSRLKRRPTEPVDCDCKFRHEHGTRRMYCVHKCGCFRCRLAHSSSEMAWRNGDSTSEHRYTDPTGTRRRIQGLAALGVSHAMIAAQMGCTKENIAYLRRSPRVHVATAQRVAEAFATLLGTPLPTGWQADRTRREAARKGWLSPFMWDDDELDDPAASPNVVTFTSPALDDIAVELLTAGQLKVRGNPPELVEAVRVLAARGLTDREIGQRINRETAAVLKVRERHSIPSGVPSTRQETAA